MRAYGYDDKDRSFGFVKINGEELTRHKGRGITVVTITKDCKAGEITNYDTHGSSSDADKLRDYLTNLPSETRLAVISEDSFHHQLGSAKSVLTQLGVDTSSTRGLRSSLCFFSVKGKPESTLQSEAARYKGPATLSVPLTCEK